MFSFFSFYVVYTQKSSVQVISSLESMLQMSKCFKDSKNLQFYESSEPHQFRGNFLMEQFFYSRQGAPSMRSEEEREFILQISGTQLSFCQRAHLNVLIQYQVQPFLKKMKRTVSGFDLLINFNYVYLLIKHCSTYRLLSHAMSHLIFI